MSVIEWLLDSDPSIRWQVMRDLIAESDAAVARERSRVAAEGWGARLAFAARNIPSSAPLEHPSGAPRAALGECRRVAYRSANAMMFGPAATAMYWRRSKT